MEEQSRPQLPFQEHQTKIEHQSKKFSFPECKLIPRKKLVGEHFVQQQVVSEKQKMNSHLRDGFTIHCQRSRGVLVSTHTGIISCVLQL